MTNLTLWAIIVVFAVVPAILVARGKKRFWQATLVTFMVLASGWVALLSLYGADLPPWIAVVWGMIGITIGQRIVKANWEDKR